MLYICDYKIFNSQVVGGGQSHICSLWWKERGRREEKKINLKTLLSRLIKTVLKTDLFLSEIQTEAKSFRWLINI